MNNIPKLWGKEEIIVNNDLYCAKYLYINRYRCSSVHYHKKKDETFFIKTGKILLEIYKSEDAVDPSASIFLCEGDTYHIPPNTVHQFRAMEGDACILEVSTHHEDSDVYRIE